MPGPAVHHRVAETLKQQLADRAPEMGLTPDETRVLIDALDDPKNAAFYFLGCQGPDPFFFNTKDVSGGVAKFVAFYLDFVDTIEKIKDAISDAVPEPVHKALDAAGVAADAVITEVSALNEVRDAFRDIKRVIEALIPLVTEAIKRFVTEVNVFDLLDHPYRDGASEGGWWWFDAMHYRRTGAVAEALLNADSDVGSPMHLYALGYLTHVGADTVGHAYVNLWSGGPYRSHGQRHKTGENFQDVRYFDGDPFHPGSTFEHSRLHWLYNFNWAGGLDPSDTDEEGPDEHSVMPDKLSDQIAAALNAVYDRDGDGDPDFASRIAGGDVRDAYRLWYAFIRSASETGTLKRPEPYSLTAELEEVWEKAKDQLADVKDFLVDSARYAGKKPGLLGALLMFGAMIAAAVMAAAALVNAVLGALTTLSVASIRWAASLIYEQLYNAFDWLREGSALAGVSFPMQDHLSNPLFAQFVAPDHPDPTGIDASNIVGRSPLLRFEASLFSDPAAVLLNQERHLIYPLTDPEKRGVRVGPQSYLAATPEHYALGSIPLDLDLLDDLASSGELSEDQLEQLLRDRSLGDALSLTAALYGRWRRGERLPDFNLDADRGYGYTCWTQPRDATNAPSELRTNTSRADRTRVDLRTIRTGGEP